MERKPVAVYILLEAVTKVSVSTSQGTRSITALLMLSAHLYMPTAFLGLDCFAFSTEVCN